MFMKWNTYENDSINTQSNPQISESFFKVNLAWRQFCFQVKQGMAAQGLWVLCQILIIFNFTSEKLPFMLRGKNFEKPIIQSLEQLVAIISLIWSCLTPFSPQIWKDFFISGLQTIFNHVTLWHPSNTSHLATWWHNCGKKCSGTALILSFKNEFNPLSISQCAREGGDPSLITCCSVVEVHCLSLLCEGHNIFSVIHFCCHDVTFK